MKGSRKLTFEKPSEVGGMASGTRGGDPSPCPSPKKSPKSVSIRTHDDNYDFTNASTSSSASPRVTSFDLPSASSTAAAGGSGSAPGPVQKKPPPVEIQFQFQLTEHFDQSTPPPNCTSNGNYEFEQPEGTESGSSTQVSKDDPQLREIATKFVNDIIENAKVEAANRAKAEQNRAMIPGTSDRDTFSNGIGRGATPWYRRAHGLVSKWITNICVRAQNTLKADLK
ncbi:unnamed protein product [Orchesella dallaii]|uniref:Uncharacterized protein n=1 Tax=Orchesella dallaii TaxID=48710 RepID=A0ABP1PJQ2_9HEXA